jgi:uncharacterized membrane protein YkvA (DUF1232 family)
MPINRRLNPLDIARFIWHLPNFVKLYVRLFRDRRVSLLAKGLLIAALAYIVLPWDFVPEFVPFLGRIDDVVVIIFALRGFIALCPREVVREHVAAIDAGH